MQIRRSAGKESVEGGCVVAEKDDVVVAQRMFQEVVDIFVKFECDLGAAHRGIVVVGQKVAA